MMYRSRMNIILFSDISIRVSSNTHGKNDWIIFTFYLCPCLFIPF